MFRGPFLIKGGKRVPDVHSREWRQHEEELRARGRQYKVRQQLAKVLSEVEAELDAMTAAIRKRNEPTPFERAAAAMCGGGSP